MSPEQAAGQNQLIDERSDIYSLCVLFHEFLSLHHYLPPKNTLFDLLYGVVTEASRPAFVLRHPTQGIVPIELSHFISKGLSKEPEKRFASVHEMQEELARIQGGYIKVQCPTTLIKRAIFSLVHFVERFPSLSYALIVGLSGLLMLAIVSKLLDWLLPS
jgi:serine/threonine-protein kinase